MAKKLSQAIYDSAVDASPTSDDYILGIEGDYSPSGSPQTKKFPLSAITSLSTSDATTTSKGKVQLAGDLSGTAALPTVPGLALKAPLASPTFTGTVTVPTPVNATDAATKTYVDSHAGGGSGTVTSVSVASANGLSGTVANSTTTPAITLSTSITGILKGNGTAISAATSGTDYALGTSALATGILKNTTTTGAHTIAVAADFPTLNQNTTGTASNITGTLAAAQGGTGATTTTGSGANVLATSPTLVTPLLGTPTSGVATNLTGLPLTTGVTGTLPIANGGTNATTTQGAINATNPHTTLGDISYRDTTNVTRLAGNTTSIKQFLTQTGTGTVSAAPAWGAIQAADVPTLNQSTTGNAATATTASAANAINSATTTVNVNAATAPTSGQVLTATSSTAATWQTPSGGATGIASATANGAMYATGATTATSTAALTNGQLLIGSTGTTPVAASLTAGANITITPGAGTISIAAASGLTNPMTTSGDVIYGGASGVPTRLAGNTSTNLQVLTQTGTGSVSAAPVWVGTSGAGNIVRATNPVLVGPFLGVATATSFNAVTITAPATSATLTLANGSSLVTSGAFSTTLTATAATNVTLPTSGTLMTTTGNTTGTAGNVTGTVAIANGGTGSTTQNFVDLSTTQTIAGAKTFSGSVAATRLSTGVSALTDGATIVVDASLGNTFPVTIAGNRTISNPTNAVDGQQIVIRIKQDATGSRTITWDTNYRFSGGTAPTLTTTASKTDYVGFKYNGTDSKWDCLAFQGNY